MISMNSNLRQQLSTVTKSNTQQIDVDTQEVNKSTTQESNFKGKTKVYDPVENLFKEETIPSGSKVCYAAGAGKVAGKIIIKVGGRVLSRTLTGPIGWMLTAVDVAQIAYYTYETGSLSAGLSKWWN